MVILQLSEEQLNNLNHDALVIIAASLQDQLVSMKEQLDYANSLIADNNRQIELLTKQIKIMNQRHFGKSSESNVSQVDGQLSLFDSFNEVEATSAPSVKEPEITGIIISSYKRSKTKGKRDEDLDGLPARIIEHKLSDEELSKKFPNGYKGLPVEIYKRLHIIPETFIAPNIMYMYMHPLIITALSKELIVALTYSETALPLRLWLHQSLMKSM